MAETAAVAVPRPLAVEILQEYGDVLRVGSVRLNGSKVCWCTAGSTANQLEAFTGAFCGTLRKLPEAKGLETSVLCEAVYWFCKVVSINYVLGEVLDLIKDKVGKQCSVRTTSNRGGHCIMDYSAEVRENHLMRVQVSWHEKDNVIYCDPKTAKKTVKGTLSSLVTEFPLPPNPYFVPTYCIDMDHRRSFKEHVISKASRMVKGRKRYGGECLSVSSPLHSSSSWSLDAVSTQAPSSLPSEASVDSEPGSPPSACPQALSGHSILAPPCGFVAEEEPGSPPSSCPQALSGRSVRVRPCGFVAESLHNAAGSHICDDVQFA